MRYRMMELTDVIKIKRIATLFYMEYEKGYSFPGEKHDFWEFIYCDHGEVLISFDEEFRILPKGHIAFHQPNEFHRLRAHNGTAPNIIVVSFESESKSMDCFQQAMFRLSREQQSMLARIVQEAGYIFQMKHEEDVVFLDRLPKGAPIGTEQYIKNLLEIFLIELARNRAGQLQTADSSYLLPKINPDVQHQLLVRAVMDYLEENLDRSLTAEEVCRTFYVSKAHLAHIFKQSIGKGYMRVFAEMKIKKAKILLRHFNYSVTQVSGMLGYSSVHYFSKCFKKATGMSPLEYSKSIKIQLTN